MPYTKGTCLITFSITSGGKNGICLHFNYLECLNLVIKANHSYLMKFSSFFPLCGWVSPCSAGSIFEIHTVFSSLLSGEYTREEPHWKSLFLSPVHESGMKKMDFYCCYFFKCQFPCLYRLKNISGVPLLLQYHPAFSFDIGMSSCVLQTRPLRWHVHLYVSVVLKVKRYSITDPPWQKN